MVGAALIGATALPAPAQAAPENTPPASPTPTTVTLATGDQVDLTRPPVGEPAYTLRSAGEFVSHQGAHGERYVIPADVQPYLGRQLDLSLFDVSALVRAGSSAQIPVSLTFAEGTTPAAPAGVTLTSINGSTASGYLTPASGTEFAAALRSRIAADVRAGRRPGTEPLAAGLTAMRLATPASATQDREGTHTLRITGLDETGAPATFTAQLMNTDSISTLVEAVPVVDGVAEIEVPEGHYAVSAAAISRDSQGNPTALRFVGVDDITVNGTTATTEVTVDMRAATSAISATTPRPSTQDLLVTNYFRFDTTGQNVGTWAATTGQVPIYVNPRPAPQVGTLRHLVHWGGLSPNPSDAYRYNVAFASTNGVAANQAYTVRADQLATVRQRLHTDPAYAGKSVYLLTGAIDPVRGRSVEISPDEAIPVPGDLTQYLGTANGGQWSNSVSMPFRSLYGDVRGYRAGQEYTVDWGRGPVAAGLGQYSGAQACLACVAGDTLTMNIPAFRDSQPDHTSGNYADVPTRFTLHRNNTLLVDADDLVGATVAGLPAEPATIRATLDVNATGNPNFSQATQTHTELAFRHSPSGTGDTLPAADTCAGQTTSTPCRVLPVLTLGYDLAADRTNTSGLAVQTMGVRVGHVSYDGAGSRAAITSLTVSVSFDGGTSWQPATVTGSAGKYTATWPNPKTAQGTSPALRVRATDAIGGSITQTIGNAYTIAKSAG